MANEKDFALYKVKLLERTRSLRDEFGLARQEMATHLGVTAVAYQKYETRTPLPHQYIEKFCLITGVSIEYFITGNQRSKRRIAKNKEAKKS